MWVNGRRTVSQGKGRGDGGGQNLDGFTGSRHHRVPMSRRLAVGCSLVRRPLACFVGRAYGPARRECRLSTPSRVWVIRPVGRWTPGRHAGPPRYARSNLILARTSPSLATDPCPGMRTSTSSATPSRCVENPAATGRASSRRSFARQVIAAPVIPASTSSTPSLPCTTTLLFSSNSLWWISTPSATCFNMGPSPFDVRTLPEGLGHSNTTGRRCVMPTPCPGSGHARHRQHPDAWVRAERSAASRGPAK